MTDLPNPLGTSIRIFLANGAADGVWVVEKSNWTGKALMAPRTRYKELRARPDLDGPGVYLLIGPTESGVPAYRVYIGETDDYRLNPPLRLREDLRRHANPPPRPRSATLPQPPVSVSGRPLSVGYCADTAATSTARNTAGPSSFNSTEAKPGTPSPATSATAVEAKSYTPTGKAKRTSSALSGWS